MGLYGLIDVFVIRLSSNGATLLTHTPDFTRSSITSGRNLRPPWLLGPVSRKNSLNSFFSLYKNPIDLNLNPISSESDEIGIQTQMFKMASRARIAILRDESSRKEPPRDAGHGPS